jgi:hypothetical protein
MRILFWIVGFKGGKRQYWILTIAICLICAGCGPHMGPSTNLKGEWRWTNDDLSAQRDSGSISTEQAQHEFTVVSSKCRIEALRIPIPSPSCTQPPRQDCAGMTGFALGFCRSFIPPPQCDYSSVNAAKSAQFEVFESCLTLNGWRKVWVSYEQTLEKPGTLIEKPSPDKATPPTKPQAIPPEKPLISVPVSPPSATTIVTVTWTFANIRSGAGNNYSVVTTVKQGDKLTTIGESGEWFNVRLEDGKEGWISNKVVK